MFNSIPTHILFEIYQGEEKYIATMVLAKEVPKDITDTQKEQIESDLLLEIVVLIEMAKRYDAKLYIAEPTRHFSEGYEVSTSLLFMNTVSIGKFLIDIREEYEFE
ncbi:MAG: hypothetical protein PHP54_02925 [Clostridia bacterium]|nr:hypothetical protein [Clostridia bacterium]